eukprot:56717_1
MAKPRKQWQSPMLRTTKHWVNSSLVQCCLNFLTFRKCFEITYFKIETMLQNQLQKEIDFFRNRKTTCNEGVSDNIIGECEYLKRLSYGLKFYKTNRHKNNKHKNNKSGD